MHDSAVRGRKRASFERVIVTAPLAVGAVLLGVAAFFGFNSLHGLHGEALMRLIAADSAGFVLIVAGVCAGWIVTRRKMDSAVNALEGQNAGLVQHVRELESSKREADTILGSVRAHLMLIDGSFLIQSRYSNELEAVFRQKELANENFLNVLQRLLSDKMFKTARDYLTLLFDPTRKERTLLKVNPLDEVEINVSTGDGSPSIRYLSFAFRRIVEDGAISRVLVSVEDVTERTVRERQLRESEKQKVKQFELLIGILHVDPRTLDGFVQTAQEQLHAIDEALRASDFASATIGQTALLRSRLDVVLQRVHNIKGNATLLRLDHFERKAADFEQRVADLRNRSALGGDDFLSLVIELAEFRGDLDDLQALRVKLAGIQRTAQIREREGDELVANIDALAKQLGQKLGKEVRVDAYRFDTRGLDADRRLVVKDVLIQLTRNALAHGIEEPATRESHGKPRVATLDIHPMPDAPPNTFAFVFRDDGRGLDPVRIRERAVESGLLAPERAGTVDDSDIAGFIFAPAFSTAEGTTNEAGRGMGMNVIKQRVVDECGGEISVNSETGRFCEFAFVLPVQNGAAAAAYREVSA